LEDEHAGSVFEQDVKHEGSPLLSRRRGGRDIKKNIAKPPLMGRTGWCGQEFLNHHPVCTN
jgi:hypothetical protein